MSERARIEAPRDVEHDAPGARRAGRRALGPGRFRGRRDRDGLGRVPARAPRREQRDGQTRRRDALHGSGEDLTRLVFPARTSMTYWVCFPSWSMRTWWYPAR